MNYWALIALVIGLLIIGTVGFVKISAAQNTASAQTTEKTQTPGCTSCGSGCTAEKNCGLSTCGAANGGSCGCNG